MFSDDIEFIVHFREYVRRLENQNRDLEHKNKELIKENDELNIENENLWIQIDGHEQSDEETIARMEQTLKDVQVNVPKLTLLANAATDNKENIVNLKYDYHTPLPLKRPREDDTHN